MSPIRFRILTNFKLKLNRAWKNKRWLSSKSLIKLVEENLKYVSEFPANTPIPLNSRIVLICMTRDEQDLLDFWLSHHASLSAIEAIVIIDHCSRIPVSLSGFNRTPSKDYHLYRFEKNSFLQAHVLNEVANQLVAKYPDSILLPIDTDEFLPIFESNFILNSDAKIGKLEWRLTWPVNLFEMDEQDIIFNPPLRVNCLMRLYGGDKHFLHSSKVRQGAKWSHGSHLVYNKFGLPKKSLNFGSLVHIPVRSPGQIASKFSRGESVHDIEELRMRNSRGERLIGGHWRLREETPIYSNEFILDCLSKYYDGPILDSREILWKDLISGKF